MGAGEPSNELSASAERLVGLAREELGEMSARRRAEGRLTLTARNLPRARRSRFILSFAAVLVVGVSLVFGHRWIRGHAARELSYGVHGGRIDATGAVDNLMRRFLRVPLTGERRQTLIRFLEQQNGGPQIDYSRYRLEKDLRELLHLIMSTPEYQLS